MITSAVLLELRSENRGASDMLIFIKKTNRNNRPTNILKFLDFTAAKIGISFDFCPLLIKKRQSYNLIAIFSV